MPGDGVGRAHALTWTRVLFVLTIIGALVSGYFGLEVFVRSQDGDPFGRGFWDIAYYDLQLFVLGSDPLVRRGPYPPLLELARFAAPAVTIYALFEASRALFAGQFRRWRTRRRRGNIVVVGQTPAARALVARLRSVGGRRQRRRVVAVSTGDAQALREAGVAKAKVLYAFGDDAEDGTVNVATALAAATVTRARLRVYSQVSNATLALAMRARRLGLPAGDRLDVDFVNLDEVAARGLLAASDVTVDPDVAPHILIAGLGTFGQAVLVEYARAWRLHSPRRGERVAVTLVDPRASTVAAELAGRWEVLRDVFDVTPVDDSLTSALRAGGLPPHRAYICYDDEELALSQALTTVELWRGKRESIVVRLNRLSGHEEVFHAPGGDILDDVGGRLRVVSLTKIACDPEVIGKDLTERLAEAIHERYLLDQVGKGARLGEPDLPSMRAWPDLPERMRAANRAQAGDIGRKVRMVGCAVAPRTGGAAPVAFSPAEVEALAVHEHDRWSDERRAEGLRYGQTRDWKHHPGLVPWDRLPEFERERDREAVRNLPRILADVGLQLVRLPTEDTF